MHCDTVTFEYATGMTIPLKTFFNLPFRILYDLGENDFFPNNCSLSSLACWSLSSPLCPLYSSQVNHFLTVCVIHLFCFLAFGSVLRNISPSTYFQKEEHFHRQRSLGPWLPHTVCTIPSLDNVFLCNKLSWFCKIVHMVKWLNIN